MARGSCIVVCMQSNPVIFDRKRVALHKQRAAARAKAHDFLFDEMEARIAERLGEVKRRFDRRLDISGRPDAPISCFCREDERLECAKDSFDLITSPGGLHWVNDLPGMLAQIQHVLAPDGLFIGIFPGGETLKELRTSLEQAELVLKGGISPRIAPFIDVRDAGSLLQRAGFALPVVDSEVLTIEYDEPFKLLADLRGMGETNALIQSTKHFTPRRVMTAAMEYYRTHFTNAAGRVVASMELVTLTGWKSHASQQQPAKRGSGRVGLGEVLQ